MHEASSNVRVSIEVKRFYWMMGVAEYVRWEGFFCAKMFWLGDGHGLGSPIRGLPSDSKWIEKTSEIFCYPILNNFNKTRARPFELFLY